MGLRVLFVSGPRQSGKSTVIRAMIDRLWKIEPHYVRLIQLGSDKLAPRKTPVPPRGSGIATARWLEYDEERVFEILPEALTAIHREDRYGAVIVEADADPNLRCAFPYDHRVFVMPVPRSLAEVFRSPHEAATEFRKVLDDTAAFAEEIFGLFREPLDEEYDSGEERVDLTETQMRGFLYSPLGDELATRIQLQTPYHGLVESDVVLMNTRGSNGSTASNECLGRIQRLFDRLRLCSDRRPELFLCDPLEVRDKKSKQLYKSLKPMCTGGK